MPRSTNQEPDASGARRPKRRAIIVAALVVIGLMIARALMDRGVTGWSAWAFGCASALAVLAAAVGSGPARVTLGLAVVAAAMGWFDARVASAPRSSLARWIGEDPRVLAVVGMVEGVPEARPTQRGAMAAFARFDPKPTRFRLLVSHVDQPGHDELTRARGRLWVRLTGHAPGLQAGDRVRITGMARAIGPPTNPGEPDWRPLAWQRGIVGSLSATDPRLITPARAPPSLSLSLRAWTERTLGDVRTSSRRAVASLAPEDPDHRAMLEALLLGHRDHRFHELATPWVRAGVAHVLAVSGLHLAIAVWGAVMAVRLTGDRPRAELIVGALVLIAALVITPARPPIVRAVAITAALGAGRALGRRYDALTMLAWVMIGVLAWRPMELWSAGFQLSFGVVAGLMTLAGPLREHLFGPPRSPDERARWGWLTARGADGAAASLAAWVVAGPIVAAHFGVLTPYAPALSMIVTPLAGLALLAGHAALLIDLAAPPLAQPVAALLLGVTGALGGAIEAIERLPGSTWWLPHLGALWGLLALAAGSRWVLRGSRTDAPAWALTLAAIVWASAAHVASTPSDRVALRLDTLDVGDGSAHLVRTPGGAILFDCGSRWFGIGQRTIPDALRALGAHRVRTIVVSHPDTDHFSGVADCLAPLGVRTLVVGEALADQAERDPAGPAAFLLRASAAHGVEVRVASAGDEVDIGRDTAMRFLWPPAGGAPEKDNDASLVGLVEVETGAGPRRLLLSADIEREAMRGLEPALPAGWIDITNAPHHGSARPFAIEFVRRLGPRVVVQSSGPSRLGDERWDEIKERAAWLMTAEAGAVSVEVGRDGSIRLRSWRGGPGPWSAIGR